VPNRTRLFAAIVILPGLFAGRAAAHPVPAFNYDRIVRVTLTPKGVRVDYRIELDDATIQVDGSQIIKPEEFARLRSKMPDSTPTEIGDLAFANAIAEFLSDRLQASQDGELLDFHLSEPIKKQRRDNLIVDFVFEAAWVKPLAARQPFQFSMIPEKKDTLHLEKGRLDLAFAPGQSVLLSKKKEPNPDLIDSTDLVLAPKIARAQRTLSATMEGVPSTPQAAEKSLPELREAPTEEPPTIFGQVRKRGLKAILDSNLGFGLLLVVALVAGAAHALTPGHGKTLVAAYLVGERGTIGHAFLLGLITTITHTGIVIILAGILPWLLARFEEQQVQTILGFGGGFIIAGMGLWLLLKRLSGQADHVHVGGGRHHHHGPGGHHHHHHPPPENVRTWNLIVLGISGGIVPCWDAIALLAWSISTGRARLGLPLLLAFSAGLAGVLVLVGILVVKVKRFGASKLGEGRLVRALPIISAIALTLLGAWLCIDSVTGK
jgi:ABC-type nickel/cobalt efflux system permease component RcnA